MLGAEWTWAVLGVEWTFSSTWGGEMGGWGPLSGLCITGPHPIFAASRGHTSVTSMAPTWVPLVEHHSLPLSS